MELEKFTAPFDKREEIITKVTLLNDEWLVFLRNLSNIEAKNTDTKNSITKDDIEWIDTTRCVPLCVNENFIKRYNADTRLVSIVCKDYGDIHLRLWFAEKGVITSINKVMTEIFPGALPEEVLRDFWEWWQKLPIDSQQVGGHLVTKRQKEFGIGHLSAWIQKIIDIKPPQVAWQNFLHNLRPWMLAHELFVTWTDSGIIKNDNGKITPINLHK